MNDQPSQVSVRAAESRPEDLSATVDAARSSHLDWIDTAKAGAIVLVVLYHVGNTYAGAFLPVTALGLNAPWRELNDWLIPVRMPLFFLVSGMLATRAVSRPWSALRRPKVADLLWPFALWSVIYGVATGAAYATEPGGWTGAAFASWWAIPAGGTAYWYLTALVVFFCVARLARRFGAALVLVAFVAWLGASGLSVVVSPVLGTALSTNLVRWCYFAVWFMVGCFARDTVARIARLRLAPTLVVSATLYVVIAMKVYGGGATAGRWVESLNVLGIVSAILASVLLSRSRRVRRVSRYLAARTLPIYLVHPVVLCLALAIARRPDGTVATLPGTWIVGALFTPVVTIALVLLSTWTYDRLRDTRASVLFRAPRRSRDLRPTIRA
ncbi:acyltransferase [Oerskovia sp. Root22]|uniref:acyltransferase family protein n=1 Tax=Oerskovia sp. Root22 TaxID=1736494 RepID=UPI0006FE2EA9|nr:acyltransferase [Oerskovia sp. Root22]KRC34160.1 hypothetical protein ASE15_13325 [Oerskovia sp. Root22]